jgi:hypothetical protein
MKDLPGVERHREIEIRRVNFRRFHFSPQINTDETGISLPVFMDWTSADHGVCG